MTKPIRSESPRPWDQAAEAEQRAAWTGALEAADGNVTNAAKAIGISRAYAKRLNKKYGLADLVIELRRAAGQPARAGRPRK